MDKSFYKKILAGSGMGLFVLFLIGLSVPVLAAPVAQFTPYPTPTPGPDGRVIYIAQANDSAWRIAAIFGLKLDELRTLNKWGENPIVKAGDKILLGLAGPAETAPAPGPSLTPAPVIPTATPKPGWGDLCIILYNDKNGDSLRQEEEPSIPGGAISVSNRSGTVSKTSNTVDGLDPQCFQELPEGTYNISVAIPAGYNPTTGMNQSVTLKAGDTTILDFGAQANTQIQVDLPATRSEGRSPLLAVAGALFLLLGVGVGIFAGRLVKISKSSTER